MEPVVRVDDLRVVCAGHPIVDGVSFTVAPGTVVAILGSSGSGKTTTGLALLGEYPRGAQVSGQVRVAGREITPAAPPPAGLVGFVPQHPAAVLNPVRRVGGVLREITSHRRGAAVDLPGEGDDRPGAAVEDALRRAHLPGGDLPRRYPHQLSGGQQQRLVLAQALLGDPAVIVADEPTTGQDAITRREVAAELAALACRGTATVLLCHDLDLVRALADQVVVLHAGRVIEAGATDHVLTTPRHGHTRALVAAQPGIATGITTGTGTVVDTGAGTPPPTTAADRLNVVGLHARHGAVTALHEIRIRMSAGECLAVVGRSGSGKTTLARCIAGLHSPDAGAVLLDGHPLPASARRRSRRELAAVQYVFQDAHASFDHRRAILEQVGRTAVRLRGLTPAAAAATAESALAAVGLPGQTVRRRPGSLSGGELRRAALARALLAEPEVLICDEITAGLDTLIQAEILDLLAELRRRRGLTLLLISHDAAVVTRLADRIAVVHESRIVEQGNAATVLGAPRHPVTRGLFDGVPGAREVRTGLKGSTVGDA